MAQVSARVGASCDYRNKIEEGGDVITPLEQLYERLSAEYAVFIDGLKHASPSIIITSAYEKVFKEDILLSFEDVDAFNEEEIAVLLTLDYPLDALYRNWLDSDDTYMDELRNTIRNFAAKESELQNSIDGDETVALTASRESVPRTASTLFRDVQPGDWVIAAGNNDYRYLLGTVTSIEKLGTPEHGTGNKTDDIHVDFTVFNYPQERIAEIEQQFSNLHGEEKRFGELPLDDVIMAPKMLISISNLSQDEITRMGNLRQNCESFCYCFPGGVEPQSGLEAELMERIEKNLADYKNTLLGFDKRELIDMAGKIAAMQDAHDYIRTSHGFWDEELQFYLQFQNPLEVVADAWLQRNADNEDLSFTMDFIFDKQDALVDYPLMSDADVNPEIILHRFMDVDLIDFLGKIADKVIVHHPNDWKTDINELYRAASAETPEDRRLMWHVSSYGTHLNTERETFIRDTGAFTTWVDYRPRDPDMFGYVVEVTGRNGNTITGNVFEVGDYYLHSLYVRETALLLEFVSLTYSSDWGINAGKTITVPRFEYDDDRHRLMSESGNVTAIEYIPWEGIRKMSALLHDERSRRMSFPIGSIDAHLQKLTETLAEVREPQIPLTPTDQKRSISDRIAEGQAKVRAYDAQKAETLEKPAKPKREDTLQ